MLSQVERIADLPHAPTVLYVTHHAEEITAKMTHILLLREGAIVAQGQKKDILTQETLEDFYQTPVKLIPLDETRFFIKPVI